MRCFFVKFHLTVCWMRHILSYILSCISTITLTVWSFFTIRTVKLYYALMWFQYGKKVTTRNIKRFGKNSELLKITVAPPAYVEEEIRKMMGSTMLAKLSILFQLITTKGWKGQQGSIRLKDFFNEKLDNQKIYVTLNNLVTILKNMNVTNVHERGAWVVFLLYGFCQTDSSRLTIKAGQTII